MDLAGQLDVALGTGSMSLRVEIPEAISIAKALARECRTDGSRGSAANPWAAEVLSCTGLWLSESRLESVDVIQKEPCLHLKLKAVVEFFCLSTVCFSFQWSMNKVS